MTCRRHPLPLGRVSPGIGLSLKLAPTRLQSLNVPLRVSLSLSTESRGQASLRIVPIVCVFTIHMAPTHAAALCLSASRGNKRLPGVPCNLQVYDGWHRLPSFALLTCLPPHTHTQKKKKKIFWCVRVWTRKTTSGAFCLLF